MIPKGQAPHEAGGPDCSPHHVGLPADSAACQGAWGSRSLQSEAPWGITWLLFLQHRRQAGVGSDADVTTPPPSGPHLPASGPGHERASESLAPSQATTQTGHPNFTLVRSPIAP